jgi:hypothetical protein
MVELSMGQFQKAQLRLTQSGIGLCKESNCQYHTDVWLSTNNVFIILDMYDNNGKNDSSCEKIAKVISKFGEKLIILHKSWLLIHRLIILLNHLIIRYV